MSLIELDKRVVWFDNNRIDFKRKSKNFLTPREKEKIKKEYNYVDKKGVVSIFFFAGSLNSTFSNNQILNSNFYKQDFKIKESSLTPFKDDNDYLGNSIETSLNPVSINKTYGQSNPSEIWQEILEEPFDDAENIENISDMLKDEELLKYARYYNSFFLSGFNGNISIFNTIKEVDGTMLIEKNIKGISVEIQNGSTDSLNRVNNISNSINIQDTFNNSSLESFLEFEVESIPNRESQVIKPYKYTVKIVNGIGISTLDTSEESFSSVPSLTNRELYYTDDVSTISPFNDGETETLNQDINKKNFFMSLGYDIDKNLGGKPDSIAFIGEND